MASKEEIVRIEDDSGQTQPTPQALFGLAYLALSPFSLIHPNIRFTASAAFVVAYAAVRPKILGAQSSQFAQILDRDRLRQIYVWATLLFLYVIFCSTISATILLQGGEAEGIEILDRGGKQLGSLFLGFIQIGCGFHMANYMKAKTMRSVIYTTFWITIALCIYQNASETLGLPYIGTYAKDPIVGLRPSGLAVEPKYLAVYLLCVASLLLVDKPRGRISRFVTPLPRVLGIALSAYFFWQTSSGNGYSSAAILVIVYFFAFPTARKALLGLGVALMALAALPDFRVSDLDLRESHVSILENITEFDLRLFDDLIALPMMAWRDNPLSLMIGFGPGLMHFFARRYLNFSTWLEWDTLIEGNISAITYISNLGLIAFLILFLYIFGNAKKTLRSTEAVADRPLSVYFASIFITGALIGSNISVPLFLAIGWILGTVSRQTRRTPNKSIG